MPEQTKVETIQHTVCIQIPCPPVGKLCFRNSKQPLLQQHNICQISLAVRIDITGIYRQFFCCRSSCSCGCSSCCRSCHHRCCCYHRRSVYHSSFHSTDCLINIEIIRIIFSFYVDLEILSALRQFETRICKLHIVSLCCGNRCNSGILCFSGSICVL